MVCTGIGNILTTKEHLIEKPSSQPVSPTVKTAKIRIIYGRSWGDFISYHCWCPYIIVCGQKNLNHTSDQLTYSNVHDRTTDAFLVEQLVDLLMHTISFLSEDDIIMILSLKDW